MAIGVGGGGAWGGGGAGAPPEAALVGPRVPRARSRKKARDEGRARCGYRGTSASRVGWGARRRLSACLRGVAGAGGRRLRGLRGFGLHRSYP